MGIAFCISQSVWSCQIPVCAWSDAGNESWSTYNDHFEKKNHNINFTERKFHFFSQRKLRNCKILSACLHCCFRLRDWKADSNIRGWWRSRQWNPLIWYWNGVHVTHFFSMSLLIKVVIGLKTLQLSLLLLMCQIFCMSVCTCILMLVSHLWFPIKTYYKYRSISVPCKKSLTVGDSFENCVDPQ